MYGMSFRDLGCSKRVLVQKRVILQVDISSISGFTDIGETDILTASLACSIFLDKISEQIE